MRTEIRANLKDFFEGFDEYKLKHNFDDKYTASFLKISDFSLRVATLLFDGVDAFSN